MSFVSRYLDAELVEQLNHMQLAARSVVEGSAVGLHRSQMKGASVEFRQHRAYVAGDEPRRLDWRVLARTNKPFVKEYDEETNLRCLLMLDCSGSMAYGARNGNTKFEFAGRLASALSYLMLAAAESVGLVLTGPTLHQWLPPRSGSMQLTRVIESLEQATPAGCAALKPCANQVAARLGRRALVILISDFFSPATEIREALARLRHDRHELICLRVLHKDEIDFPFRNWSLFHGLEGEREHLTQPALVRRAYLSRFERHARELAALCRSLSADLHTLTSDQPIAGAVRNLLRARARK